MSAAKFFHSFSLALLFSFWAGLLTAWPSHTTNIPQPRARNIPYHELQTRIAGLVLTSHESDANTHLQKLYNESIYVDNGSYQIRPQVLVLPLTVQDVQETLVFAQRYQTSFSVKGGGHSAAGYCLNHDIVLDMRYFNRTFMLDASRGIALIEAGMIWKDVYPQLDPFIPIAGTCPLVGAMGFVLGGGYSMLSRSYGLASDQILQFDMVTSDAKFIHVNNETYPDLFWALKGGGGGNFGVVTAIRTQTYRSQNIFTAEICWTFEQAFEVMDFYNKWTQTVPKEMAVYVLFFQVPQTGQDNLCLTFVYNGAYSDGYKLYSPFLSMGGSVIFQKEQTFITFIHGFSSGTTDIKNRLGIVKSGLVNKGGFTKQLTSVIYQFMKNRPSKSSMLIVSHVGGRIREIDVESSAFYRRDPEFTFEVKAIFTRKEDYAINSQWIETFYAQMKPHFNGAYINYIDAFLPKWKEAYYGPFYDRLLQIKKKYDPTNFFNFKQSIGSNYDISNDMNEKQKSKTLEGKSVQNTRDHEILKRVHLFQLGQVTRDVSLLSTLFAEQSVANIPIGSSQVIGKENIITNFGTFFNTLVNISESITSKIEVNELYAGFTKTISQYTKKGCLVNYHVVNWFHFNEKLEITEFSALFNLTHVIEQANCKT
ncbi:hypothetical protein C9374_007064 [Naegleria lovaniensis]|uniref:FAD-binding PCMH-type domain-containing protein n=1 Tax=Naegleria lovaniensis TaxID=51637 RepID=A0AA88KPT5_NAELO|nr:uncharacterized protein C9374_007064 [Naegleria lovaniensis]KAG2393533.1 hypothetical protein C9374_007064 [Naegleria lovaniensis]